MGWGDELMVTGQVREAQERDPRRVRIVYEKPRWHEAWDGNPRIAGKDEKGDFQELVARVGYCRPYIARKTDERWTWKAWGPPRGELYLTAEERAFGERFPGRLVLEPNVKPGASPNKDWGWERWVELARLTRARGLPATQIGRHDARRLPGVEFVETSGMRRAAALLERAWGAVLPEGGLHHVAAAVGTPRVIVLFGGYIAPAVTGYAGHVNLFTGGPEHPLGCGWRRSCRHCAAAMARITPAWVMAELERLLERTPGHLAA